MAWGGDATPRPVRHPRRPPYDPAMAERIETALGPVEIERAGDGPPVLVVHGTPGGSDAAMAMGRFLVEAGLSVIAPSRPGYLGTPLGDRTAIDTQADLHAALLDALGHPTAGVLAWSGGGPSAYRLAARHPGRVTGLVATAALSGAYHAGPEGIQERLMMNTGMGNWLMRFLTTHAPKAAVSGTLGAEGSLTHDEINARTAAILQDEEQTAFVLTIAAAAADRAHRGVGTDNDLEQFASIGSLELERVTAPVLLVHGDADTDVPIAHTRFAAAALPSATADVVTLSRGTHLALWVHPDAGPVRARAAALLGAPR